MAKMEKPDIGYFQSKLKIDRDDLDSALMEQPDLFYRISEELSLTISRRDECKLELERVMAEASERARIRLAKKLDKVTESAVKQEVELDKVVIKIRDEFLEWQREVGKWSALKEGFDQRSKALKDLANLYGANYFTRSSVSGAQRSTLDRDADEARAAGGMARRKRMKE